MNSNFLSQSDRLRWSATPSDQTQQTASAIAEFLMIEECVERCEAFAEALYESGTQHPIMDQLSECIAACQNYTAAKARESGYEDHLADLCQKVLAATSLMCRELDCDTSIRCRMACEVALEFVYRKAAVPTPLFN